MSDAVAQRCTSCQGAGELGTDNGPIVCPDCFGDGRQLDSLARIEWRLRDIERAHETTSHGCEADMRWLVFELRRSREALLRILSRCQEEAASGDGDGAGVAAAGSESTAAHTLAVELQYAAIRALGLYEIRSV